MTYFKVKVWHAKKDRIDELIVALQDAMNSNSNQPCRVMAGVVARQRCAQQHNEEYSPNIFKVLSVEEIKQ